MIVTVTEIAAAHILPLEKPHEKPYCLRRFNSASPYVDGRAHNNSNYWSSKKRIIRCADDLYRIQLCNPKRELFCTLPWDIIVTSSLLL